MMSSKLMLCQDAAVLLLVILEEYLLPLNEFLRIPRASLAIFLKIYLYVVDHVRAVHILIEFWYNCGSLCHKDLNHSLFLLRSPHNLVLQ